MRPEIPCRPGFVVRAIGAYCYNECAIYVWRNIPICTMGGDEIILETLIAHELSHALQHAHGRIGTDSSHWAELEDDAHAIQRSWGYPIEPLTAWESEQEGSYVMAEWIGD